MTMKRTTLENGFCVAVAVSVFLFLVVKTGLWKPSVKGPSVELASERLPAIKTPQIEPQKQGAASWSELSEVKATNTPICK